MTSRRGGRPVEILLVEDNPDDVVLTEEALMIGKVWNNLSAAKDGVEAMDFLRRCGKDVDAPRPDLILLDLNLPRKDGREVLAEIVQKRLGNDRIDEIFPGYRARGFLGLAAPRES